ncbi:hypothetical protein LFWB_3840 [Candidatus Phytoplasma luffae]|uniref:Uncharacterized protein n=1 Tax=Loofah witches'-broom phytoplasma TaxID=35773 RepID=A0A975FJ57_LOWBP|nr:hypothetical protein [Candidatus Phytoplasma luffae]QTX02949.1 hypothetical protein LFWB_3810 [Candidatus Phytoplasma luffae]QTX02952.1 hypothetical protein LFWB_3840 [Candidatus Phytoplasma luffae]
MSEQYYLATIGSDDSVEYIGTLKKITGGFEIYFYFRDLRNSKTIITDCEKQLFDKQLFDQNVYIWN